MSDPDLNDAALRSGSSPASPSTYRGARKHFPGPKPYVVPGDPGQLVFAPAVSMSEPLSVACGTEDDFELDPFAMGYSGQRKIYRGRGPRGRSSYDPGRGRRRHGDQGAGTNFFNSSFRARGRERGY